MKLKELDIGTPFLFKDEGVCPFVVINDEGKKRLISLDIFILYEIDDALEDEVIPIESIKEYVEIIMERGPNL